MCNTTILGRLLVALIVCLPAMLQDSTVQAQSRLWSNAAGNYKFNADMIGYSSKEIVLKTEDGELVSVQIEQLSDEDKKFVNDEATRARVDSLSGDMQVWEMASGLNVKGRLVEFGQREVTIRRHMLKTYVNDKVFDNLPAIYRQLVPKIVTHFEKAEVTDKKSLDQWISRQVGRKKTYTCEGVLFELENGDRYGVPFFVFSENAQKAMRPAFERWKKAEEDAEAQERESMYLRSAAWASEQQMRSGDAMAANQLSQLRDIAQMQLQVSAYDAGAFNLWKVSLEPPRGSYNSPVRIMVPGRSSEDARLAAQQQYPGYQVVGIAKARRRW